MQVGILSKGLLIAPPEAPVTGYMFGKGLYFADMVTKRCRIPVTQCLLPTPLPSSPTELEVCPCLSPCRSGCPDPRAVGVSMAARAPVGNALNGVCQSVSREDI